MKKNISFIKIFFIAFLILSLGIIVNKSSAQSNSGLKFEISFPSKAHPEQITGRVYVIISRNGRREPRLQRMPPDVLIWGKKISFFKPGEAAIIDDNVFGFPLKSIRNIPPGDYYVQGFINIYMEFKRSDGHTLWMHNDQWEGQRWNISPGNIYSNVKQIEVDPSAAKIIQISCENVIPPVNVPPDTNWVKRIKFQSKILTEFWGQPIYLGATILKMPLKAKIHQNGNIDFF